MDCWAARRLPGRLHSRSTTSRARRAPRVRQGRRGPPAPAGTTPTINAQSPLSYSVGTLSIDLSSYATKQYVDDAIAAPANLEEEEF